jgi:hypothetical protein
MLASSTLAFALIVTAADDPQLSQAANSWIKRSPLADTPPSPRLGYEGACVWDSKHHVLIRYGGHNQGGGGEQHAEVWTFDPITAKWTLKEPNTSPPGICCGQQNAFDPIRGRYIRFPAFSGSHGWQWAREIYLNDSSVWTYDLATNTWRNMRPLPSPNPRPLRCASWDWHHTVVVLFGGEGSSDGTLVYDPYRNSWTRKYPTTQPEFRSGGNMAYDAGQRLHILFGSQFSDDPHTWAYDLRKNEWRDMQPDVMPPTDKNDAVLSYDPYRRCIVAIVKITEGSDESAKHRLETWNFNTELNRWTKMNPPGEPDPSGNRARVLVFASELNVAILENRTHPPHGPSEQQIWTYRLGRSPLALENDLSPPPDPTVVDAIYPKVPPIVEDAVVSVIAAGRIDLTWKAPRGADIAGYHVERAIVDALTEDQLKRLKSRTPSLDDPSVGAFQKIGPFARLTTAPRTELSFTDTSFNLGSPQVVQGEPVFERSFNEEQFDPGGKPYRFACYAYRIHTVNSQGLESGPSPAFFTIPSAPQFVFSKEDGATCHLKWSANPERGIRGYRVYRMDGRYDKEPITRLTDEPIAETQFSDPAAGKPSRRYYVVAVDALGQEGFPSSPVWFNREWRQFYEPFTSEWHQ